MSDLCVWQCHSSAWYDACVCAAVRQASPCVTVCDLAHSCVRHGSFVCAPWLMRACDGTASEPLCNITHLHSCATWLVRVCDMNHLWVQLDFWVRASAMRAYVSHDSFVWVTWLISACKKRTMTCACTGKVRKPICDTTHPFAWRLVLGNPPTKPPLFAVSSSRRPSTYTSHPYNQLLFTCPLMIMMTTQSHHTTTMIFHSSSFPLGSTLYPYHHPAPCSQPSTPQVKSSLGITVSSKGPRMAGALAEYLKGIGIPNARIASR